MVWSSFKRVLIALWLVILAEVFAARLVVCPKDCVCDEKVIFVNCQNKNLTGLPEHVNSKIKVLDLSYNNLTEIPAKLSKLHNLEHLILNHNHIKRLDKAHLNISSLLTLNVSHNNITSWFQVQNDSLNFTKSILELDLSYNAIKQINNAKYFLKSKSLEVLKMRHCSIGEHLPKLFLSGLTNLKRFIISDNSHLRELDNVNSSYIEVLEAMNCGLESVNLSNFPNLKEAVFRGSRISYIEAENFKNYKLQYLDLSDNGIKFINRDAFENLPELKTLDLSTNVFNNLDPNTFIKNVRLETLVISHTYLKNLVPLIIPSLLTLDLSINEIQTFKNDSLVAMPSLQHLNLYRNLISRLPNQILSHSLLYLNLSTCQIIGIKEKTFSSLMNLRSLDLSSNRLTSVKPHYLPKSLHKIKLDNNLWRCECYSKEFKEQYDSLLQPYELTAKNSLICHSPENVSGLTWEDACGPVWNNIHSHLIQQGKMWMYIISMVLAMSVIFCATMCIRRMHQVKLMREQSERLRQRMEAQERLNSLRRQQQRQIEAQQNAPDPRELQRPPSYHEAIRMPRIDGSYTSLAASRTSISASRQSIRASRASISDSRYSLATSQLDLSKTRSRDDQERAAGKSSSGRPRRSRTPKSDRRRRRRRSRVENSGDFDTQSVPDLATEDNEATRSMIVDSERSEAGEMSEAAAVLTETENDTNNNKD